MAGNPHQYYDSFAEELRTKFQRVSKLVSHNTTTGDYHEEILRVVLRNFLSKRFSVKKGFIYKNEIEVSNQLDIIIVDEYQASAYIYQEGDFAVVRPSAVVAVIEVKTTMGASQFDQAIKNIASAKELGENSHSILGMVFAYDGANPKPSVLDSWFKRSMASSLKNNPMLGPAIFSFFQRGVLLARHNSQTSTINDGPNYHAFLHFSKINPIDEEVNQGWQLRIILALIYSACESIEFKKTRTFSSNTDAKELLLFSGGINSRDYYSFGTGFHRFDEEELAKQRRSLTDVIGKRP
ncbi:MAG TPA: DUF6602 domain-containing protein [Candidatus Saccharimonadales bacterium]|jgi:hypothetical protein